MKHCNLVCLLVVVACGAFGQQPASSTVYLKNGSIIKGTINENNPDSTLTLLSTDGIKFTFDRKAIEAIADGGGVLKQCGQGNLNLGFNAGPEFQNAIISAREMNDVLKYGGELPPKYIPQPGFAGGFSLYYQASTHVGIISGFQYHYYSSCEKQANVSVFPYSYPTMKITETFTATNHFHSLQIPLLVSINTRAWKRIQFHASLGLSVGMIVAAHHELKDQLSFGTSSAITRSDSVFTRNIDSTSSLYALIHTGAGIWITLPKNILLDVSAIFSFSTSGVLGASNPDYITNHFPYFPYSLGLNVGVLFGIQKKRAPRKAMPVPAEDSRWATPNPQRL